MPNSRITEISIYLNSGIEQEHFLSILLKTNSQKYEHSFPLKMISLDEVVKLYNQKVEGLVVKRHSHFFYGEIPKVVEIGEFQINLMKEHYNCSFTMAFMEEIQIFYKTYADIRLLFDTPAKGLPSLTARTKFVEKEFIHIIRDNKKNSKYSRKESLYERILKVWDEEDNYPMLPVSEEELMKYRLSQKPGVVYKKDSILFYAGIPENLNLNTDFERSSKKHTCGEHCSLVCSGCPRTRDFTVNNQERGGKTFARAVQDSWRIEKYPFVLEGIESFNMGSTSEACLIFKCTNYVTRRKEKSSGTRPSKETKLSLAYLYWDDFNGDYNEMRRRIKSHTE